MINLDTLQRPTGTNFSPFTLPFQNGNSGSVQPGASGSTSNDLTSLSLESRSGGEQGGNPVNFAAWSEPSQPEPSQPAPSQPEPSQAALSQPGPSQPEERPSQLAALGTGHLRFGDQGENIKALQRLLNEKSGSSLEVDGKFGSQTLAALKQFQTSQGLEADGIVGQHTRGAFSAGPADASGTAAASGAAEGSEQPAPTEGSGASEQAAEPSAGAPGAKDAAAADDAVPGTEDTDWTEKLPKKLQPHAEAFVEAGKKHGVDPRFLAAISMQETGNGTSYSMRHRNNAMGIMKGSKHRVFDSVAASIDFQARSLTREGGYYEGKDNIKEIGKTYAPVGAKNDPGKLNGHWIPSVTRNFTMLGGSANSQVKGFDPDSNA